MRVGLLGCGSIGGHIAKALDDGVVDGRLVSVYDIDAGKARDVASKLRDNPRVVRSFTGLLQGTDIIVEAASQGAVKKHIPDALSARKSVLIMSSGALLDAKFITSIIRLAEKNKVIIYVPSGAVCGIDGLKAASVGGLKSVLLQTTKPPTSLKGFEYFKKRQVIFEGSALEAVRRFPANVNVSAVLSLAALGGEKTMVRLVVDPDVRRNTHEVFVKGVCGSIYSRTENVPAPENPKTSYLACLSAVKVLQGVVGSFKLGT